jgi:uncharacterized membrane protein
MSQLIVLGFQDETSADQFIGKLQQMEKEQILGLSDLVKVVRTREGKTKIKQGNNLTGVGALSGAFWGMLIGFIFLMPWLGLAVGAASGALAGHFADYGISDEFIKEVGEKIQPGQAAVFMLVEESTPDKVEAELEQWSGKVTVIKTNLTADAEEKLKEAFSADAPAA